MRKRYFISIILLVLLSLGSLKLALDHLQTKSLQNILGSYTFNNTKAKLFDLGRVTLSGDNGQEFNLYYENGIWYFEEAGDYFVDDEAMHAFYKMINNSALISNAEEPEEKSTAINIKTYDTAGNLLDDIDINGMTMNYAGKSDFYQISNVEKVSLNPADWLPSPLLKINPEMIAALNINGKYAEKSLWEESTQFSDNLSNFFKTLKKVDYVGIMPDEMFDEEYPEAEVKDITVYIVGGLIYRLKVYFIGDEYYLRIEADRELIARREVNKIIDIKNMYYKGWSFLLPDLQGKTLFESAAE